MNDKKDKGGCLIIYIIGIIVSLFLGASFGLALIWPIGLAVGCLFLYYVATGQDKRR